MENKLKYCLYARKSSEQDERQAMSIDSQLKEMQALAEREGLLIVEIKRESHSAKLSGARPVFLELIKEVRVGKFNAILTWAPDRMSRNAGDLGTLVDLMDSGKLEIIRTHSQSFSNNPNEKFLLMILCSQAKLENDNRAINVKRGIRAKCEMGWRPCMPPLGYYSRGATGGARDTILDEERAPYIKGIFEMSAAGKSGRHIKLCLEENGVKTRSGKKIPLSMIYKILKNTFYYGEFEYPAGSGKWYMGNHPKLVSKELFDEVQEALVVPLKSKWGSKDFPFKNFLKCYSCGSTIVGEDKQKQLMDGSIKKHVYYHCSRQVDYDCPEKYVTLETIIGELTLMCGDLVTDTSTLDPGLIGAINKFGLMMKSSGNTDTDAAAGYVKYVLQEGTEFEKTRLIRNLKVKLALHNKRVVRI